MVVFWDLIDWIDLVDGRRFSRVVAGFSSF